MLAVPTIAVAACPNEAIRTGPSAGLPDCRAYEQVTPVNKEASQDLFTVGTVSIAQAADSGEGSGETFPDRALLFTDSVFGKNVSETSNTYVFSRSLAGWTMTSATPANAGDANYALDVFSPDLLNVAEIVETGSSPVVELTPIPAVFGPVGGPYTTAAVFPTAEGEQLIGEFVGASSNFKDVLLQSLDHELEPLAEQQVGGSHALYEWADGHPQLVNVTTGGSLTSTCGAILGNDDAGGFSHNAVSNDGSKVFFESPDPTARKTEPACQAPTHLYMRLTTTTAGREESETVDVSAPESGVSDPQGFQKVGYAGADTNGSRVLFLTETELTADDLGYHDPELYEYDTETRKLTRVSRGTSGTADGNLTEGWAIISADGSTVYFAAHGQVAAGAPSTGVEEENVYRYDTTSGATTYITTVNTNDYSQISGRLPVFPWSFGPSVYSNWYTTPNGRFLVFWSSRDLTGYNPNAGNPSGRIRELYRYDAADGSLVCVSCLPHGGLANGSAEFAELTQTVNTPDDRSPRPISDNGGRVFFDSPDQLVPQDTNGVRDVYEWEQEGVGSCADGDGDENGGCLYLISSGRDSIASVFNDASASGDDVFFGTHAQLAPTDTDFAGDLYDARVNGGFPPPASTVACSGEGCKPPASPPPSLFGPPASATFSGHGNPAPVTTEPAVRPKPSTRAQKLARALRACAKQMRRRRAGCESRARDRYGATAKSTKGAAARSDRRGK